MRSRLMVEAIRELQAAGVEPDLCKIEGLDRRQDCESVAATARDSTGALARQPASRRWTVSLVTIGSSSISSRRTDTCNWE
jgi:hypothetical protein